MPLGPGVHWSQKTVAHRQANGLAPRGSTDNGGGEGELLVRGRSRASATTVDTPAPASHIGGLFGPRAGQNAEHVLSRFARRWKHRPCPGAMRTCARPPLCRQWTHRALVGCKTSRGYDRLQDRPKKVCCRGVRGQLNSVGHGDASTCRPAARGGEPSVVGGISPIAVPRAMIEGSGPKAKLMVRSCASAIGMQVAGADNRIQHAFANPAKSASPKPRASSCSIESDLGHVRATRITVQP